MAFKFFTVDEHSLACGHHSLENAIYEARSVAGLEPNLYGEVCRCRVCPATDDGRGPDLDITVAEFQPTA